MVFEWPNGENKLSLIAKVMCEKAGFTARHVNHSGRKSCITQLLDTNKPPTEVAQLSGHKNIQSLNHYNTVSLQKQIEMSFIVHGFFKSIALDKMGFFFKVLIFFLFFYENICCGYSLEASCYTLLKKIIKLSPNYPRCLFLCLHHKLC